MSPSTPKVCTHQRGPGTTVCLRCRFEERERARANFVRMLLRGAAVVIVGGAVVVAVRGVLTLKRPQDAESTKPAVPPDPERPAGNGAHTTGVAASPVPPPAGAAPPPVSANPTPIVPPAATPSGSAPTMVPVLGMGRTPLSDSVYAERDERGVRVHFDTQWGRTRQPGKFEVMVRTTLPRVYGPKADSALALIPPGTFARDADLIAELPTRGIRLPVPGGGTIVIWPETREVRDGPILVSYRTVIE